MRQPAAFRLARLPLALTLLAAGAAPARAQVDPTWSALLDQSQTGSGDTGWRLLVDAQSGRSYVGGWIQVLDAPATYWGFVAAIESSGALAWFRPIAPAAQPNHFVYRLALHPAGGVVAAGQSAVTGLTDTDALIARVDAAGNLLWTTIWDGPAASLDDATSVVVDAGGTAFVFAPTWNHALMDMQGAILRVGAAGAVEAVTLLQVASPEPCGVGDLS